MNTPAQVVKEPAGFDIDSLDDMTEMTHRCAVVTDDEGEPISGFILAGKNSLEFITAFGKNRTDNIQRAGQRKKVIDTATEAGAGIVAKTVERNDRAIALAVVVGWFGFKQGGKDAAFDKTIVNQMFDKVPQWQAKVLADLEVETNFMPASSKA